MKKWIALFGALLVCGVAEAGKVIVTQYNSSATADLVAYTYSSTTTFNWLRYRYETTEAVVTSGQMADSAAPNYNYIYAATLDSATFHVVGTSYPWRVVTGTVLPLSSWGAVQSSGTFTAIP